MFTKQNIREYIQFENCFGECPWGGMGKDETHQPLYKRYRRRFPLSN